MNASTQTWLAVYADQVLAEDGLHFYIDSKEYKRITSTGLHFDFERAAFVALLFLSERVLLAQDPYDIELSEDFELPQGPNEGLPKHWYVEYQPNAGRYLVLSN